MSEIVFSRQVWQAKPPRSTTAGPRAVKVVYLHHTAGPGEAPSASQATEAARMRTIQHEHQVNRGFADISYSKVVFPSGRAYEGRGWGVKHGANFDGGTNETSYSVCLQGNYEVEEPTAAQIAKVQAVIAEGIELGFVSPSFVFKGHREEIIPPGLQGAGETVFAAKGKACPGRNVLGRMNDFRPGAMSPEEEEEEMSLEEFKKGMRRRIERQGKPPDTAPQNVKDGFEIADAIFDEIQDAKRLPRPVPGPRGPAGPPGPPGPPGPKGEGG